MFGDEKSIEGLIEKKKKLLSFDTHLNESGAKDGGGCTCSIETHPFILT